MHSCRLPLQYKELYVSLLACELRKILRLRETPELQRLSDAQLASLLYRDSLVLKHSASCHIKAAVAATVEAAANQKNAQENRNSSAAAAEALTAAILEFLIEAGAERMS